MRFGCSSKPMSLPLSLAPCQEEEIWISYSLARSVGLAIVGASMKNTGASWGAHLHYVSLNNPALDSANFRKMHNLMHLIN